jgi:hypothetical protein
MTYFLFLLDDHAIRRAIRENIIDQGHGGVYVSSRLEELLGLTYRVTSAHDLIVIIEDPIEGHNTEQVALEIKKAQVLARIFVFTPDMEVRRLLPNGKIPKSGGVDLLASFIRSIQSNGYDRDRLRTEFPEIRFSV